MNKSCLKIFFWFILFFLFAFPEAISVRSEAQVHMLKQERPRVKADVLKPIPDFGKVPIYFIPNEGQVHNKALYYARTSKYTLWITAEGLVFDALLKPSQAKQSKYQRLNTKDSRLIQDSINQEALETRESQYYEDSEWSQRSVSRLVFLNSNPDLEVVSEIRTSHTISYLIGSNRKEWKAGLSTSRAILYRELYKNIDLRIYGMEEEIEYDFIVSPGGNINDIRFEYRDVLDTQIDKEGNLLIKTEFGELKHSKPGCYQKIGGNKVKVKGGFREIRGNIYGFTVSQYNKKFPLVIDPLVMVYSTFLGGNDSDVSYGIAVDSSKAVYVTGYTYSLNYPTKKPIYGSYSSRRDAFITKIAPNGKALVYSTYLGGSDDEMGYDIAADSEGAAYVTGYTESKDFPIVKPFMKNLKGGKSSAFVTKIDPEGKNLIFSTYLGGSKNDTGVGIALNSEGAIYIAGTTYSSDFPTKNPIFTDFSGMKDVFVVKMASTGKSLIYSLIWVEPKLITAGMLLLMLGVLLMLLGPPSL